ncbi:MAG: transcriptional regulator [Desulfurococcales archaeon]|nr:transcriptional regulator [Desulfurococcales archaeon]
MSGNMGPGIEIDLSHIPLKPVGAKEVRELEITLIIATIFRPDVINEIMDPKEFTTWLDSLAVAAGALAREKAGYTISRIAEELGRTEATIRNHLQGKTKAGKLVRETYDMLKAGKLKLALPIPVGDELNKLRERVARLEQVIKEAREELLRIADKLSLEGGSQGGQAEG